MQYSGRTFQAGESVYSEWFPRGGDNAIVRAQLVATGSTSSDIVIKIYTKDSETVGNGGTALSTTIEFDGNDADGLFKEEVLTGEFDEMIRLGIVATGDSSTLVIPPFLFFDASHP